jgi:hypothetical protein
MTTPNEIMYDVPKFAVMYVVARLITGGSFRDMRWQSLVGFTLLGLALYHLFVKNLINTTGFGQYKGAVDDTLKFGTAFLVAQLLEGRGKFSRAWGMSTVGFLAGLALYNLFISNIFRGSMLFPNQPALAMSVDDILKFGSALLVSQLAVGGSLNGGYMGSAGAQLVGFTVFNLLYGFMARM